MLQVPSDCRCFWPDCSPRVATRCKEPGRQAVAWKVQCCTEGTAEEPGPDLRKSGSGGGGGVSCSSPIYSARQLQWPKQAQPTVDTRTNPVQRRPHHDHPGHQGPLDTCQLLCHTLGIATSACYFSLSRSANHPPTPPQRRPGFHSALVGLCHTAYPSIDHLPNPPGKKPV